MREKTNNAIEETYQLLDTLIDKSMLGDEIKTEELLALGYKLLDIRKCLFAERYTV